MNKIKQIKLKHFKFFYGEVTIDLERNHALIFGENGIGLYIPSCRAFLRQTQAKFRSTLTQGMTRI